MGPAVRPRPASPHGTPLPRKRATAGGKLPCHVRRRKHSTRRDMHRRALRSSVPIRRDSETRGDWTPALHRQRRWTTGPTGGSDPGGRRSRPRTVTLRHDLYRTHEGDSHLRRTVGIVKPVPTVWRMVGPVLRPKPASPHGTPLPGKRATADGESPCHMRRENHSALGDACCRVRPGGRIGRNGVSPSAGGGAWWGPPPGRSRHPHMSLRFRGSVLRPAENYRVHAPVEA